MIAVLSELWTLSKAINCDDKPASFKSFHSFHKFNSYEEPSLIYNAQMSKSFAYSIFNISCS